MWLLQLACEEFKSLSSFISSENQSNLLHIGMKGHIYSWSDYKDKSE